MITFITNPAAGSGKSQLALPIIKRIMDASGHTYEIKETTAPAHAAELARAAAESGSRIVAGVGGDGTVQEIVAGLTGTNAALAIIPAGSGNDVIRSLNPSLAIQKNFAARVEQFLQMLLTKTPQTIDVIRMNGFHFLNIGSVGIDAEIVTRAAGLKKTFGKAAYLAGTLQSTFTYKPKRVCIECDGQVIDRDLSLAAVSNGQFYGGGFNISPGANMADGQITLCVIDKLSRFMFGALFPLVLFGAHTKLKQVQYINCEHVTIHYDGTLPVNLDGNIYNLKAPLSFDIVKGGLQVIKDRTQ